MSVVFCLLTFRVSADYIPPDGTQNLLDFLSPVFLAGSPSITSFESPQADAINPAISGANQRVAFDFSYIALADLTGGEGWGGHIVNLGQSIPTRVGVFTWSGHFLTSTLSSADLGTFGTARFSFAKDLYPNFLIGTGIRFGIGSNDVFDWALSADMGFLHFLQSSVLPNLRWGVVLRDFGKGFDAATDKTAYPAPFTLATGIGFSFIRNATIDLSFSADLSFPSFQNIRADLGLGLKLFDFVTLQVSSAYDLQELINAEITAGSFIPSFGLSFVFKTDIKKDSDFLGLAQRGWGQNEVKAQTAAAPLHQGIWGFGLGVNVPLGSIDSLAPEIVLTYDKPEYISPNLDGISDYLSVPISITDQRYVRGYAFSVANSDGEVVRRIQNKDERPENIGFRSVIDRLGFVDRGIEIPDVIRWDGNDNSGTLLRDGEYRFAVEAWDDNGNSRVTEQQTVFVDSTPPWIEVSQTNFSDAIFSPNNDGNKDTFTIEHTGSTEDIWFVEIKGDSGTVMSDSWNGSPPVSFSWDGKDESGALAPDGIYRYIISSTDRGGNSISATVDNIILNTESTPIDVAIGFSHFSPNGDGRKDEMELSLRVPVVSGLTSWVVEIIDSAGTTVRTFSGNDDVPETVWFDGIADSGISIAEQEYRAKLTAFYLNGNSPSDVSPRFVVDLTPPDAFVTADLSVFSPNADGNQDVISFFQESSIEDAWKGRIMDTGGRILQEYSWLGAIPDKIFWDGHESSGLIARDGTYAYFVETEDKAGNRGQSASVSFVLNTEKTSVFLSRKLDSFSPNSDGSKDIQVFFPQITNTSGIVSFALRIYSENEVLYRTFTGRAKLDDSYVWQGLSDAGVHAPDGIYFGQLEIQYANGNKPTANTRSFSIDTSVPNVQLRADKQLFSPNGDGNRDTVTFISESSEEELWEARVVDDRDVVLRRVFWKGYTSSFVWDGTDEAGNGVVDGLYYFEISTEDAAGNRYLARTEPVLIDTRPTTIFVTADRKYFSPNGDGVSEAITFNTIANVQDGVEMWRFAITDAEGVVIRSFFEQRLPQKIVWDGRDEKGTITEGIYTAEYSVSYKNGNTPVAKSTRFGIDVSAPETTVRIDPKPFSPDNDGVDDELKIELDIKDSSDIGIWHLIILDQKNREFKNFSGMGKPSRNIIWDGKSNNGELVLAAETYSYVFEIEDELGNAGEARGEIPVDVLVFRDGNRLKIRISNITFEPNSPSLASSDTEALEKNDWILKRIAEILDKYSSYFIRIEGHAVSIYWDDSEKADLEQQEVLIPLSESRAQTVMEDLILRGISEDRLSVVGVGGAAPIVPHGDVENRWKNRRVEFILLK